MSVNPDILKLALVNSFGRNALHPALAARLRLVVAFGAAIILGVLAAKPINGAPLPQDLPWGWLISGLFFLVFCITSFLLLILFSSFYGARRVNALIKITTLLPINRMEAWVVTRLPLMIIAAVVASFMVPLVTALAAELAVSMPLLVLITLISIFSSLGFVLVPDMRLALKAGLLIIYSAGGVWLLEKSMGWTEGSGDLVIGLLAVLPLTGYIGYWQSYRTRLQAMNSQAQTTGSHISLRYIYYGWFLLKLLRNHRTRSSILFCTILCVSLAVLVNFRSANGFADPSLLWFGAFCAAAFSSDIRGISKRYKTTEISGVKSVAFFVIHEFFAGYTIALLFGLPLLLVTLLAGESVLGPVLYFVCIVLAGISFGLVASTIFVPEDGNVGAQFFAAVAAVAGLFYAPKWLRFEDFPIHTQAYAWVAIGLLGLVGTYIIEFLRRRNYANA